jgi:hypothetical protein
MNNIIAEQRTILVQQLIALIRENYFIVVLGLEDAFVEIVTLLDDRILGVIFSNALSQEAEASDIETPIGSDTLTPVGKDTSTPVSKDAEASVSKDAEASVSKDTEASVGKDTTNNLVDMEALIRMEDYELMQFLRDVLFSPETRRIIDELSKRLTNAINRPAKVEYIYKKQDRSIDICGKIGMVGVYGEIRNADDDTMLANFTTDIDGEYECSIEATRRIKLTIFPSWGSYGHKGYEFGEGELFEGPCDDDEKFEADMTITSGTTIKISEIKNARRIRINKGGTLIYDVPNMICDSIINEGVIEISEYCEITHIINKKSGKININANLFCDTVYNTGKILVHSDCDIYISITDRMEANIEYVV